MASQPEHHERSLHRPQPARPKVWTVDFTTADFEPPTPLSTMSRAECRCPDDCDCDGRFACEVAVSGTSHVCELAVGHTGWHQHRNHRWQPARTSAPEESA